MSTITAVLYFEVEDFLVAPDLLSTRNTAVVGGYNCTLIVPQDRHDFDVEEESSIELFHGWIEDKQGQKIKWNVALVKVEVELPSAITASDYRQEPKSAEPRREVARLQKLARKVASEFIQRVFRHVAVEYRQPWLGPSTRRFTPGWKGVQLYDRMGERIPLRLVTRMKGVNLRLNVPVPNHHEFATLVHGVSDQEYEDPPLPETLLADALYASDSAEHPDLRMATLFAAMACEVKMIETMRNLASQEQVELLEMVFDRRVVQGVALFKKGISAICGRSLARDDPSLYQALAKLFKDRNTIAHLGGAGLMEGDLKGHAQTARKVLDWIDGVIADASQQQSFLASSTASGSSTP